MAGRFETMAVFVAVCDASGFAAAARRLDLSPSAVTRIVAALEGRLGVRLLQRTTRTMRLTEAGERFAAQARRILADLDEAEASAQGERGAPRGTLVIAAPDLFGRLQVAPVVTRFLERYPSVAADLRLTNSFAKLVEEGVDVAIRIGAPIDSELVTRMLGHTRPLLVASPAYLGRLGRPRRPQDLADHALAVFKGITPRREWPFRVDGRDLLLRVEPRFVSDSGSAAIAHVVAGGGILPALRFQVAAELAEGRLVEVLADFAPPPVPICCLFPSARQMSAKVRGFLDLLDAARPSWSLQAAEIAAGPPALQATGPADSEAANVGMARLVPDPKLEAP